MRKVTWKETTTDGEAKNERWLWQTMLKHDQYIEGKLGIFININILKLNKAAETIFKTNTENSISEIV